MCVCIANGLCRGDSGPYLPLPTGDICFNKRMVGSQLSLKYVTSNRRETKLLLIFCDFMVKNRLHRPLNRCSRLEIELLSLGRK